MAEEKDSPNMKVRPTIKAAVGEGGRVLLLINALQTFGYRCQCFSLSMMEASLPPHLSEQLMHWLCKIQRLWRRSVLAPVRGELSFFFFFCLSPC